MTGPCPGTYYIHAQLPVYVDPLADLAPEDFASRDPAVRLRVSAVF